MMLGRRFYALMGGLALSFALIALACGVGELALVFAIIGLTHLGLALLM